MAVASRTTFSLVRLALLGAAGLTATLATPAQAAPRTFTVANATEMRAALISARVGDTVLLAPGSYGDVSLDRFRFTGGFVNIRSADPVNRARFGRMALGAASGLSITGVDIQSSLSPVVSISGSNIRFAGNRIRGAVANGDPWDDNQAGMSVRFASNIVIASNDFQDLRTAIYMQRTTSVAIRHNDFTVLREGLNVAGGARGDIENNYFSKFSPNYGAGEHADAIQFWNRNEPAGASHFRIRNNFLSLGNDGNVHGLFIGTENASLPHSNFEISGNIYYGSALHGISLGVVNDTRVFNNIVIGSPWADTNSTSFKSADGRQGGGIPPSIALGWGTGVQAWNNVATNYRNNSNGAASTNSIDVFESYYRRGEAITNVLTARPMARYPALSEFVSVPTSVAATRGIGVLAPFRVGVVTLDPAEAQAFAAAQPLP